MLKKVPGAEAGLLSMAKGTAGGGGAAPAEDPNNPPRKPMLVNEKHGIVPK